MVLSSKGACHLFKRSSRLSEDGDKCAPKHFPVSFICIALGLSGVFTLLSLEFSVPLSFSSSVCKATSATCDRNFSPCSSFLFLSSFLSWIFFCVSVSTSYQRRSFWSTLCVCLDVSPLSWLVSFLSGNAAWPLRSFLRSRANVSFVR